MSNVIGGVVIGIAIGIILVAIAYSVYSFVAYKKSPLTGEWYDEICDEEGHILKTDVFSLKHNCFNNTIKGRVHRIKPENQNYRRCHCVGVYDSGHMILIFWPIRKNNTSRVNGCIYMNLENDNFFRGYYLTEHYGQMDMTPITLKKNKKG